LGKLNLRHSPPAESWKQHASSSRHDFRRESLFGPAKLFWIIAWLALAVAISGYGWWNSTEPYRRMVELGHPSAQRFAPTVGDYVFLVVVGLIVSWVAVYLALSVATAARDGMAAAKARYSVSWPVAAWKWAGSVLARALGFVLGLALILVLGRTYVWVGVQLSEILGLNDLWAVMGSLAIPAALLFAAFWLHWLVVAGLNRGFRRECSSIVKATDLIDSLFERSSVERLAFGKIGTTSDRGIVIVSTGVVGAGRTYVASNLALHLARLSPDPDRLCIVNADLRNTDVASGFDLQPELTIADAVQGAERLDRDASGISPHPAPVRVLGALRPSRCHHR